MRNSRIVSAIVLALVCVFVGGGLGLASAEPANNSGMLQSGGLTRGVSTNGGFTLEPDTGNVGTHVKITPPKGGGSSGSTGQFTQVDAFGDFALALGADQLIYSWGDNTYGQLGIGVIGGNRNTPQLVQTPAGVKFKEIGAGQWHSVALDTNGNIWTWGRNNYGQLGIHNFSDKGTPQLVPDKNGNPNSNKFKKVSAGGMHSAAIDMDGHVWSWGCNERGQIGIGYVNQAQWQITQSKPFILGGKEYTATDIDCGGEHTLAKDNDNYLWAWGRNQEYQLGFEGDNSDVLQPSSNRRPGWATIQQIAAGGYHSEIIGGDKATGVGSNSDAQAGNAAQNHWGQEWRLPNARGLWGWTMVPFTDKRVVDANSQEWAPDPYGKAKYVSAGYYHSLGIAQNGNSSSPAYYNWGWGRNEKGELGSNASTNYGHDVQAYPALFAASSQKDFKTLAAGKKFSVGLTNDGHVYTWGTNDQGQLGDGSSPTTSRSTPQTLKTGDSTERPLEILGVKFDGVDAPKKSVDASSGAWNVDAPTPSQVIGSNNLPVDVLVTYKDMDGSQKTTTLKYTYLGKQVNPIPTPPPSGSCTVSFNLNGAPGAAIPSQTVPCGSLAKWPGDTNPKWYRHWFNGWKVQGSNPAELWDFNKPVTKTMTLLAQWGGPYDFDMTPNKGDVRGAAIVTVRRTPGNRDGFKYVSVSAGNAHTLAVGSDGYLYSWGNNDSGQLGDGSTIERSEAVRVKTPDDVRFLQVAAGGKHSLALDSNGNVWGWGQNAHGQVGNQSVSYRYTPVQVNRMEAGSVKFKEVSAGAEHSLAVDTDGHAWSWGYNANGILGLGNSGTDEWHPKRVSGGVKFAHLSAGYYHSAGVDINGEVWSWGRDNHGQLGDQATTEQWHPVQTVRRVNDKPGEDSTGVIYKSISAGNDFTVAVADDGSAWSWGKNSNGQLGNNWIQDEWHPIKVHASDDNPNVKFKEVSAGGCHVVALDDTDWVYSWGCNTNGRLGLEPIPVTDQWKPRSLHVGYSRAISAGDVHSAVIWFDGQQLKTWGDSSPQLGRGNPVSGVPRVSTNVAPPFVGLASVEFGDRNALSIDVSKRSADGVVWEVRTPTAPYPGRVDVTFRWTVGDADVQKRAYTYFKR